MILQNKLLFKAFADEKFKPYEIMNLIKDRNKTITSLTSYNKIVIIGASTGGAEAVKEILSKLNVNVPILISMHMPPVFTKMYADNLNEICKMEVKEAKDGDLIRAGVVFIAPGGYQMRICKNKSAYYIKCKDEGKINGHQPSVDALFESAQNIASNIISVILTGMGKDGALGLLKIRQNGGYTIGQDEKTSLIYGMPKVAYEMGAVIEQAPLHKIADIIVKRIKL